MAKVEAVATMERPEKYSHLDISESTFYSASTLYLIGLPYDYDALLLTKPPKTCPMCNTVLIDPLCPESLLMRLFSWQTHLERCEGDGRCAHAHEVVKLAVKLGSM